MRTDYRTDRQAYFAMIRDAERQRAYRPQLPAPKPQKQSIDWLTLAFWTVSFALLGFGWWQWFVVIRRFLA